MLADTYNYQWVKRAKCSILTKLLSHLCGDIMSPAIQPAVKNNPPALSLTPGPSQAPNSNPVHLPAERKARWTPQTPTHRPGHCSEDSHGRTGVPEGPGLPASTGLAVWSPCLVLGSRSRHRAAVGEGSPVVPNLGAFFSISCSKNSSYSFASCKLPSKCLTAAQNNPSNISISPERDDSSLSSYF